MLRKHELERMRRRTLSRKERAREGRARRVYLPRDRPAPSRRDSPLDWVVALAVTGTFGIVAGALIAGWTGAAIGLAIGCALGALGVLVEVGPRRCPSCGGWALRATGRSRTSGGHTIRERRCSECDYMAWTHRAPSEHN